MSTKKPDQAGDRSVYIGKSSLYSPKPADLLGALTPAAQTQIMSLGQRKSFVKGEQVFLQGQAHTGIMLLLEGEIRSYYVAPSGREITLAYWGAGHFVGGPEIFGKGTHIWSGEAAQDCQLLFLGSDQLRNLILQIPQFALNVVEALVFKATCFSALIQFLGTRPAGETLAHLLLVLAGDGSSDISGEVVLDQRYTQEELAKMIGSTRQWVAVSLSRMKKLDLLEVADARIRILSMDRLRYFADSVS